MNILKKEEMNKIYNIFKEWNETMIWSCLQGYMGSAWVDNIEDPKSAQIIVGDFCFLAGEPNINLVKNIPQYYKNSCILIVPQHEKWHSLSLSEKLGYEFDNEYVTYYISNLM